MIRARKGQPLFSSSETCRSIFMGLSVLVTAVGSVSGPRALLDKVPKQPPWSRNQCPSREPVRSWRTSTGWGDCPLGWFIQTLAAGRPRVGDQFACFSFLWFVWFLKLSTKLGSSIRTQCQRLCGPCSLATLLCSVLGVRALWTVSACPHHPLDSEHSAIRTRGPGALPFWPLLPG